jgi:hypothetical protein
MMNEQVTHFDLSIADEIEAMEPSDLGSSDALKLVLSTCRRLIHLSFGQSKLCLSLDFSLGRLSSSCSSSVLTKLDIRVEKFADCLLLLDGRFECLSTFLVLMEVIHPGSTTIDTTVGKIIHL